MVPKLTNLNARSCNTNIQHDHPRPDLPHLPIGVWSPLPLRCLFVGLSPYDVSLGSTIITPNGAKYPCSASLFLFTLAIPRTTTPSGIPFNNMDEPTALPGRVEISSITFLVMVCLVFSVVVLQFLGIGYYFASDNYLPHELNCGPVQGLHQALPHNVWQKCRLNQRRPRFFMP